MAASARRSSSSGSGFPLMPMGGDSDSEGSGSSRRGSFSSVVSSGSSASEGDYSFLGLKEKLGKYLGKNSPDKRKLIAGVMTVGIVLTVATGGMLPAAFTVVSIIGMSLSAAAYLSSGTYESCKQAMDQAEAAGQSKGKAIAWAIGRSFFIYAAGLTAFAGIYMLHQAVSPLIVAAGITVGVIYFVCSAAGAARHTYDQAKKRR